MGSQPWLHINIIQGASNKQWCIGPTLYSWLKLVLVHLSTEFSKSSQVVLAKEPGLRTTNLEEPPCISVPPRATDRTIFHVIADNTSVWEAHASLFLRKLLIILQNPDPVNTRIKWRERKNMQSLRLTLLKHLDSWSWTVSQGFLVPPPPYPKFTPKEFPHLNF